MAAIKYGAIVTEAKGKIGGTVFKSTKSGTVMQNKQSSTTGQRGKRSTSRSTSRMVINVLRNMSVAAGLWRALDGATQSAWSAAAPAFPFLDKFGNPYTGSGYQLFIQCNVNLLNVAQPTISEPPAPSAVEPAPAFTIAGTGAVGSPFVLSVVVPVNYSLTLSATSNQSPGRKLEKGQIKAISIFPVGEYVATDITAAYTNILGTPPSSANLYFTAVLTSMHGGRKGLPYVLQYQY